MTINLRAFLSFLFFHYNWREWGGGSGTSEEVRSQAAGASPCHRGSHITPVTAVNIDCSQVTTDKTLLV